MTPQVGQIWKIKDHVPVPIDCSRYVFITKIVVNKRLGDSIFYDRIGTKNLNRDSNDRTYLTWMMVNAELVSG